MIEVVSATETKKWREKLSQFTSVDVCHMPEYHLAYETRFFQAKALMWTYQKDKNCFAYPFLLSPVLLHNKKNSEITQTGYYDISGIYGFSGPLSTTNDATFLKETWEQFTKWARDQKAICEFIRFSVSAQNFAWASPESEVLPNRPIAMSALDKDREKYLASLPQKTRNMIKRAKRDGLQARKIEFKNGLSDFRQLYEKTMDRNEATTFFFYDDRYYNLLLSLPKNEIGLYAVYKDEEMIASAISLRHKEYAFYHLGAIDKNPAYQGLGNLVLFEMACDLASQGVKILNVGGGRTTSEDDPLFKFKKSNGTYVEQFYIGKRVIDNSAYQEVIKKWEAMNDEKVSSVQLQFYR